MFPARYKGLLIALSVMVLLFGIGGYFGFRTSSEEPREAVMAFDSTAVVLIEFTDHSDQANNFQLARIDGDWERASDRSFTVDPERQASRLLEQFHFLPVKRDMGMIGLVGERFGLAPEKMAQITFVQGDGLSHTLNLGSSTFATGKVGAWTYVNVPDEKIVYAVEGLLTAELRPGSDSL